MGTKNTEKRSVHAPFTTPTTQEQGYDRPIGPKNFGLGIDLGFVFD